MAAHVSSRRWLLRDIPQTYVVFVWVAFCLSLLFYFSDWEPFQREAAVQQRDVNNANAANIDKRYAGSIIVVVPERGGRCLERVFDNRTGQLRDKGFVNCNQATHTDQAVHTNNVEEKQRSNLGDARMRAIGRALRHEGN